MGKDRFAIAQGGGWLSDNNGKVMSLNQLSSWIGAQDGGLGISKMAH
jgi:hypothetical protein